MEPFSITCSTCKSRLKVRSATAIGQVVSCPKCGGMVLVKPPEDLPPEVANAATKPVEQRGEKASPHNTKDFDDVESILTGTASVPTSAASRGEQPRTPEQPPTPAEPASPQVPSKSKPPASLAVPHSTETVATAPVPVILPSRRYGLWLALSIVIGVALATAVVIAGSVIGGRGTQLAKKSPDIPAAASAKATADSVSKSTANAESESPAAVPAKAHKDLPSEPPVSTPPIPQSQAKENDPLGLVDPRQAKVESPQPSLVIGEDPLGKFRGVVEGAGDNPASVPQTPAVAETNAEESPATAPAPVMPRPAPLEIDVTARLADPLAGIDAPAVPLADFLADLSSLSTIPITLDPEGLPVAGLSPSSSVSLKLENTTVGKVLTAALQPLRLEHQVVDDQLIVSLSTKLAEQTIPVDDLTGGDETRAEQLAGWATALIEPGTWKDDEDGPSLTPGASQFAVRASDRTCAGLIMLMEKLRVARGLIPRTQQPAEVFGLQSRSSRAATKLATLVSLNYSQSKLLVIILKRLERESEVRILVDWRALAEEGWNADGEAVLSAVNKPLSVGLTELLAPMGLSWRAVDEQTVQVTAPAALQHTLELELYPARTLAETDAQGDALVARLRSALSLAEAEKSAGALRFDPASGCILASLPQQQQRQVEKLLSEWSEGTTRANE